MRTTIFKDAKQLSIFPDELRSMSEEQIIASITDHPCEMGGNWIGDYRMEMVYQRLTPAKRKVAKAAVELYKRSMERRNTAPVITSSRDAYSMLKPIIADNSVEEFWVIALNQAGKVLGYKRISTGGIDATYADVRLIMKELILIDATQFVVAHNHPSGNLRPSQQDKTLTKSITDAGRLLNIRLTDHLIIATNGYYSFLDEGLI